MATATHYAEIISQCLRLLKSEIEKRAGRIKGSGYLPIKGRGRNAPHLESAHVAILIISVMSRIAFPAMQASRGADVLGTLRCFNNKIKTSKDGNQYIDLGIDFHHCITRLLNFSVKEYQKNKNLDVVESLFPEVGVANYNANEFIAWITVRNASFEENDSIFPDPYTSYIFNTMAGYEFYKVTSNPGYKPKKTEIDPYIRVHYKRDENQNTLDYLWVTTAEYKIRYRDLFPPLVKELAKTYKEMEDA